MFPQRRLRLAIVGLGRMGLLHWQTWQAISEVDLVAVVETDERKVFSNNGVFPKNHRRAEDLVGDIDAAIIATPPDQHLPCALPLLRAGIHCLIEKPLALNLTDVAMLIDTAARHHARLAVGHSERFNPTIRLAQEISLRELQCIEVFRMATPGVNSQTDVVHDLMVHDLDWLLQTLGRPAEHVRVLQVGHTARTLARVSCEIFFQGAPAVKVTASRIEKVPRRELILHGKGGTNALMDLNCAPFETGNDPLTLQARAFLKLLHGLASPIATAAEILPVMELGERIRADCLAAVDDRTGGND